MSGFLETAVQNSQGDESIKAETLRILEEAKEIRESVGGEDAQKEYEEVRLSTIGALTNLRHETKDDLESIRAELGEGGTIDVYKYAEGDITQSEFRGIEKEFGDLQRTSDNHQPEINETLLNTIVTTNSEIIAGGEKELGNNIDFYSRAYRVGTSGEDYKIISEDLEGIRSSNDNIHTKLLQLSQVILKANQKLNLAGRLAVGAIYGSNFEETHNYATQDIVKRVIDNSNNVFAVGYNPEDGGYYVNEGQIDKSNDMEVGTYLYSLSKAQKLTSENLLMPNGPFSSSELFILIESYKEGGDKTGFGGAEVQGLFTPYLTKFEEDMSHLIKNYFNTEEDSENLVSTLNAGLNANRSDLLPTPEELAPRLRDTDTTTISDGSIREGITEIRTDEVIQEVEGFKGTFLQDITSIFKNSTEILEFIGENFEYSNNSQIDFSSFSTQLEALIQKHNATTGNELIIFNPILLEGIYQHINNIRSADLEVSFTATLTSISEMSVYTSEMQDKLRVQQEEITRLQRSRGANNQDFEDAQSELKGVEIREFEARQYQEWLEHQRASQESAGADGNVDEDFAKIEESERELQKLLMTFTGSSININIDNPVHRNYILEKPKERLILLNSAEDLANVIHEADDILREEGERNKVRIDDINPNFLTQPIILGFFTQQERLRNVFVGKFPENVFQDENLAKVIFDGSEFLWEKLFQNIYISNSKEDAISIIKFLIESKDSNFNEQENNYLKKAIPTEIYEDILGEPSELEYTGMVDDIEKFKGNINLLINPPERIIRSSSRPISNLSPSAISTVSMEGEINEFDIGFDENSVAEHLIQYIRIKGLDSDTLKEISNLFEAGIHNKLTSYVLGTLNPNNSEQLDFARALISKENSNGESNEGGRRNNSSKYRHFSVAMKSDGSILQEMGKYGINSYSSDLIQRITSQKLFAQYLMGFNSNPENNIRELKVDNNTNFLKTKIKDSLGNEELTPEEEGALNVFFQRTGELKDIITSIEEEIDGISENHRQGIIDILESVGLAPTIIDSLLSGETGEKLDLENLDVMAKFLLDVGEQLDAVLPSELEGSERDEKIKEIILQIMAVNEKVADDRVKVADENVNITENTQSILDKLGYIKESSEINFDELSKDYLIEYWSKNPSIIHSDNINGIQNFLQSLGLSAKDVVYIARSIQTRISLELQRGSSEIYAAGEGWRDGLDNPPGLYRGTEEVILQNINSGNYIYGEPLQNDNITTQPSELNQNLNTSEFEDYSAYEISGSTESPTLSNGSTIIPITHEDLKIISSSPELIKDIVRLHGDFLKTGLERLWPHKDAIFKSMGDKSGLKFNSKEGYVDKREANELFSTILYITTENPNYKKTGLSLEETKAAIIRETHGFAGETNTEATGEQGNKLEKSFIDKFTMRNQGDEGMFNYTAFSKALKGDFSPSPQ